MQKRDLGSEGKYRTFKDINTDRKRCMWLDLKEKSRDKINT